MVFTIKTDRSSNFWNKHKFFLIPIVNPDGVAYIETNETGDGSILLKRKNGRKSGSCNPFDEGVDLNRNYGFSWV